MDGRPHKWHWSDPGTKYGEYVHSERTVRLHPRLKASRKHDELWETLGHEFVHQLFEDPHSTPECEKRAYRLEAGAARVLHDFYHRFGGSRLPKCTGEHCHINEHPTRLPKKRTRKR